MKLGKKNAIWEADGTRCDSGCRDKRMSYPVRSVKIEMKRKKKQRAKIERKKERKKGKNLSKKKRKEIQENFQLESGKNADARRVLNFEKKKK